MPDYHDIILKPMCIQDIKEKLREHKYSTREEFCEDFELMASNSDTYNGPISEITQYVIFAHNRKIISGKILRLNLGVPIECFNT